MPQPAANLDVFTLSVDAPEGWQIHGGGRRPLVREEEIAVRFSGSGR